MPPGRFVAAAAVIRKAFAETVTFTPLVGQPRALAAVAYDEPAPDFAGPGATLRSRSFEIAVADVAQPVKGDRITDAGAAVWRIIQVARRDDLAAWFCNAERVP